MSFELDSSGPLFTITGFSIDWNNFASFRSTFEAGLHIIGSPYGDYLRGLPGTASINGRGGDDFIVAGPNGEHLTGRPG